MLAQGSKDQESESSAKLEAQQNQLGAKAARVLPAVESDSPISSMGGPGVITAEAEMPLI
jgi:hypothetical protein